MGTRTITTCDKCASEDVDAVVLAAGSVEMRVDGRKAKLDLCDGCRTQWEAWRLQTSTWIGYSQNVEEPKVPGSGTPKRQSHVNAENQAMRDWARSRGIPMPDRGRIPKEVREGFEQAQRAAQAEQTSVQNGQLVHV